MRTIDQLRADLAIVEAMTEGPWRVDEERRTPEVRSYYGLVCRSDITPEVYRCDDEQDGCPEIARGVLSDFRGIAHLRTIAVELIETALALYAERGRDRCSSGHVLDEYASGCYTCTVLANMDSVRAEERARILRIIETGAYYDGPHGTIEGQIARAIREGT